MRVLDFDFYVYNIFEILLICIVFKINSHVFIKGGNMNIQIKILSNKYNINSQKKIRYKFTEKYGEVSN